MFGKLLNTMIENAAERWLKSEASRRYAASLVLRLGQVAMGWLLARAAAKYGLSEASQVLIQGHWTAILELAGPVIGAALIEAASHARAKLNAKTLEVAVSTDAHVLTPATAKEVAKVELASS
jgi:hypothetical protein